MAKSTEDLLAKIVDKLDELQKSVHGVDKEVALQKAASEDRGRDMKVIQEEQKRNNDILQENTNSLNEHMHRTDLLERAVDGMDKRLTPIEKDKIEKEAISAHKREVMVRTAKIIATIATLGGIIAAAKPLLLLLLTL